MIIWIFIIVMFLSGLYISCKYSSKQFNEGFNVRENCPDLLVQKGSELHLLNSKKAEIPGVNPIKFNNLEEYTEFLDWQNNVGIHCPVLFFQKGYDAQGYGVYRIKNDPIDDPIYNKVIDGNIDLKINKHFQGYDKDNQYIGQFNDLDSKFYENGKSSLNAMNTNWLGEELSKSAFPDKNNRGTPVIN